MFDAPPDTPPPMALRAGELLRQRGVPYEDPEPSPRESGVYPVLARAATHLETAGSASAASHASGGSGTLMDDDATPMSEPPRSLAPSNLARVLEALRART